MKLLLILIFSGLSVAKAQTVSFTEIKLKPNSRFYKSSTPTIFYPIVSTKNAGIDKMINAKIKTEVLSLENNRQSTNAALNSLVKAGLTNLSYTVAYKKHGILSMSVEQEGCAAYCSTSTTYLNFDLQTGKKFNISEIMDNAMADSLQHIVFRDKAKALTAYADSLNVYLGTKEIDSTEYGWALQIIDDCIASASIEHFVLSNGGIEVMDDCEFPHAIQALGPFYALKYSWQFMRPFLKPKYQKMFGE